MQDAEARNQHDAEERGGALGVAAVVKIRPGTFYVLPFWGTLLAMASSAFAQLGYFRVENRGGVWWLIDPKGSPTVSIGVDAIRYEGDKIQRTQSSPYLEAVQKSYPDRKAWEQEVLARLKMWGFNTIGAWSDPELWNRDVPYTVMLNIAARAGADWLHGKPVDVYDSRFERTAQEIAHQECVPRARDHFLIGYFSDNELRWGPDWRGKENMLALYLQLSSGAPGRQRAIDFLRQRYGDDIRGLNRAWKVTAKNYTDIPPMAETDAYRADADQFLEAVARAISKCAPGPFTRPTGTTYTSEHGSRESRLNRCFELRVSPTSSRSIFTALIRDRRSSMCLR